MDRDSQKELLEITLDLHSFLLKGKKIFETKEDSNWKPPQTFSSPKPKESGEWEALKQEVLGCMKCRLFRTRKQVVFGEGNPQSMLLVIGEAPGSDEDRQGIPFVGKAGQLLTRMLQAIDIDRKNIFITNVLKCRPPQNRDPKTDEIKVCSEYLRRQICLMTPKVILTLGRFSTAFLLNTNQGIIRLRGKSYETEGIEVVPTFHPSALLRNPNLKRPAWNDLKLLRSILERKGFYQTERKES